MPRHSRHFDTIDFLQRRYVGRDPRKRASMDRVRLNAGIARQIYELRTARGLTQRQLAEKVGTTASVICQLEDADYAGHSLTMLQRVAAALSSRVELRFVTMQQSTKEVGRRRRRSA